MYRPVQLRHYSRYFFPFLATLSKITQVAENGRRVTPVDLFFSHSFKNHNNEHTHMIYTKIQYAHEHAHIYTKKSACSYIYIQKIWYVHEHAHI